MLLKACAKRANCLPMIDLIAILATIAGIYGLWVVGQIDFLRLVQGVYYARGKIVRHIDGDEGFVPVYEFDHGGIRKQVQGRLAHPSPTPPIGTNSMLSYPKKRPDLARAPAVFARSVMYGGFAAWLAIFSDLWLGWMP